MISLYDYLLIDTRKDDHLQIATLVILLITYSLFSYNSHTTLLICPLLLVFPAISFV